MSRRERVLKKRYAVFCEGDTEYHYIEKMRKNQGVELVLKPINMHGGGYSSFLKYIKKEAQSNYLAKFIIIDADRIKTVLGEKESFVKLLEYCRLQNDKENVPHFIIANNPDFEYVACLHDANYKGQDRKSFVERFWEFDSIDDFKGEEDIYEYLNSGGRSYQIMLDAIRGKEKLIHNHYEIKKKNFDIIIKSTIFNADAMDRKSTNIEEFFDVIDW